MSSNASDNSFTSLLYHITKNNNGVPIYPYITAVTGHRSFALPGQSEKIPGYSEQDIKEAFKSQLQPLAEFWRKSCNGNAPFIIMTGMADGADQIAAEAALELSPDLNIKIVAILPMAEDLYLNTIDNKERFHRLMKSASFKFTLPLTQNNIGFESELALTGDGAEKRRQEQYAVLGHFLAAHSHVLFAFWDGIPSTHLKGGTANTIFYKLNGNTEKQTQSDLLTFSSVGPVVHLLIPRFNQENLDNPLASDLDMSSIPVFFLTRNILREKVHFDSSISTGNKDFNRTFLKSEIRCNSNVSEIPELKSILERIGNMNKDSVACFNNKSFIKKCKESYQQFLNPTGQIPENIDKELFQNRFDNLNDYEDRGARLLAEHYAVADQIALKYQKKSGYIILWYSIILLLFFLANGTLTTLWTMRTFNWAKDSNLFYHYIWFNNSALFPNASSNNASEPNHNSGDTTCYNKSVVNVKNQYEWFCLPKSSWIYTLSAIMLFAIFFYARNQKYHYRYHRFRALAEALRIQIYWRIAGMNDCVSSYYRSHQILETEWIRAAINSIDVFLDYPFDSGFKAQPEERLKFTIDNWVIGQRNYFSKKKNAKKNEQKGIVSLFTHRYLLYFLAFVYFCLPLKGDILNFIYTLNYRYPQPDNIPLHIFVFWGMAINLLTVCCLLCTMSLKFKRSKAEAKRFEQILFPFDRATLLLNTEKDSNQQKMILRQLGTEAISENINWLLTVGEQDLVLPR